MFVVCENSNPLGDFVKTCYCVMVKNSIFVLFLGSFNKIIIDINKPKVIWFGLKLASLFFASLNFEYI